MQQDLYIIAGCNGAGKTTASFQILPGYLNCTEFINADAIAAALSPFNPGSVAWKAGRIMLERIGELIIQKVSFAIETTLSTKSYVQLVKRAKEQGYKVTLLFFWISSPEMAIERVQSRVQKGGHFIPENVIRRRYDRGIKNLLNIYLTCCDHTVVYDNSEFRNDLIATNKDSDYLEVIDQHIFNKINLVMKEPASRYLSGTLLKIHEGLMAGRRELVDETIRQNSHLIICENGVIKRIEAAELQRRKDLGILWNE